MANGTGLNVLGLLQHQRQTKKDERTAVTNLMDVFSKEALRGDSDTSYDEGIKLINDLSGKDEYTNLIGDLLVRDLSIEKDHNKKIEAWHQKKEIVFKRAKTVDPSKPTEFLEMLNDLTANGINVSKRANAVEQAQIEQGIKGIKEYRKQVEGIEGEKVWRAISQEMAPHDADAELLHLGLKADPALQPEQGRSIAFSQYSRKQKVSDAQAVINTKNSGSWREYGGTGNVPGANSTYSSITNDYNMLSSTLSGMRGNANRGGTFSLQLGSEKITGAGSKQTDLNYYGKLADHTGRLIAQMFGGSANDQIWEVFRKDKPKKDGETKIQWNDRLMKLMIKDEGAYTDKYLQTGMRILERNYGKDLWPKHLKKLFGNTKQMANSTLLKADKMPMINAYKQAKNIYESSRQAQIHSDRNFDMFKRSQNQTSTGSLPSGAMRPSTISVDADSSDYGLALPSDKFNVMGDWDFGTIGSDSLSKY